MHRVHITSTVKSKYRKSCYWNNPVNVIIFCCTKSILLTGFHCTFKAGRFVCENKKCLTKLFSRLIDIFACLKHEVDNDV